jgi:Rrf2 family protein
MTAATSSKYEARDGRGGAWPPAKAVYALRACIALAGQPGTRLKTNEIAQLTSIPRGFLSKILGELRAADIVSAVRGYHGGYRLRRPAAEIHLDELLDAVGTRDPFASFAFDDDPSLVFIADLCNRLHVVATETLRNVSLAELLGQNPT